MLSFPPYAFFSSKLNVFIEERLRNFLIRSDNTARKLQRAQEVQFGVQIEIDSLQLSRENPVESRPVRHRSIFYSGGGI